MSYQTLKAKIEQMISKIFRLEANINNVNSALDYKGVIVESETPDYFALLDEAFENEFAYTFAGKTQFMYMFSGCENLVSVPPMDTSGGTGFRDMFNGCINLEEVPPMDTSDGANFNAMFANCAKVVTIPLLNFTKGSGSGHAGTFYKCSALVNVTFEGTINLETSFQYSPNLSLESIASIVDALADLTGQAAKTMTFGAVNSAKLTQEQIDTIKAKNWNYA